MFNIGIDIVEYDSFNLIYKKKSFLDKCYSKEEIDYCFSKSNAVPYLAARFAIKEAAIKAMGQRGIDIFFSDVLISKIDNGSINIQLKRHPTLNITGSLSHEKNIAVAVVIVFKD